MHFVRGFAAWTVLCPIFALIVNIIIIEKQVSIKSMIYPKHPEDVCPRGAVLWIQLCRVRWDKEPSPVPLQKRINHWKYLLFHSPLSSEVLPSRLEMITLEKRPYSTSSALINIESSFEELFLGGFLYDVP